MLRLAILLPLATSLGAQPAPTHRAFRPVVGSAPPRVAGFAHAVDAFVRARLGEAGIEPAPAAEPHTLLRRLHLDLEVLPDESLPSRGPGRTGHGNFVLSELSLTQWPTAG